MDYAQYINEHSINSRIPTSAIVDGVRYSGDLTTKPDILKALDFYPLEEVYPEEEASDDVHLELDRYEWDSENEHILAHYAYVANDPPPPNTYSKLKILIAAQEAGFINELVAFLNSDQTTKMIWDASNTIEENALLAQYLPSIAQALVKTEAEVKAFLDTNCIAD